MIKWSALRLPGKGGHHLEDLLILPQDALDSVPCTPPIPFTRLPTLIDLERVLCGPLRILPVTTAEVSGMPVVIDLEAAIVSALILVWVYSTNRVRIFTAVFVL